MVMSVQSSLETRPVLTMFHQVPQELVDSIIDCVEELDLTQCSLVSSSWLPRAQSRIFSTVTLGAGIQGGLADELVEIPPLVTDDENFTRFRDLLRKSPQLSSYVRGLNLGLPPLPAEQPEESQWSFSNWVFRDPLALDPFKSHPPSSLRFIECQCKAPILAVKQDLAFLELSRCEDSVTLRVSGRGDPPPLSWIAPSLSRSLAIAFHSDSAAFIGIGLLEHISLKHIQHLDLLFLDQYKPDRRWLEPFFTSFFSAVVLKPGATLRVSFSGSSLSVPSWHAGLHTRFNLNPALQLRSMGTNRRLDYNKVIDYGFVWVA
ncbi:hypothetical protein C8R47DRAFT_1270666 [Mycena vitilis]|nr:hypothetical protein C8R47DRAFT_1270666 [Mycena vitilis]